jgi:hypothetical protein
MRLVVVLAAVYLAGCASEKLEQAPPAGVDFSGSWKLNVADSDDPQRLIQAQFNIPAAGQSAPPSGGPGGRNGRQGGGRGVAGYPGGPGGPVMPSVAILSEGLRWPGKQLEIKQVAGVVAFTSDASTPSVRRISRWRFFRTRCTAPSARRTGRTLWLDGKDVDRAGWRSRR